MVGMISLEQKICKLYQMAQNQALLIFKIM